MGRYDLRVIEGKIHIECEDVEVLSASMRDKFPTKSSTLFVSGEEDKLRRS
jgi:hypothetical protein